MPVAAMDKKKSNKCLKARKSNLKIKLCHVGHELPHCVKSVQIRRVMLVQELMLVFWKKNDKG